MAAQRRSARDRFVDEAGNFSIAVTLTNPGSNVIVARDTDAAGNTGTLVLLILCLRRRAPIVTITGAGVSTNQPAQTIAGSVSAGDNGVPVAFTTVTLVDNGATLASGHTDGNGNFSIPASLPVQATT